MAAKKKSSRTKAENTKSLTTQSPIRKTASSRPAKVKPAVFKQEKQPEAAIIDAKSLKTIRSLTGYLSIAAVLNAFVLIVQLWATFKAGFVLSGVSFVYILFSIALIYALVWCINLLKQRRELALWVFIGFIAVNFIYTLVFRLYGGKDLFASLDIVAYIVQAAIFIELYRLKRNEILN